MLDLLNQLFGRLRVRESLVVVLFPEMTLELAGYLGYIILVKIGNTIEGGSCIKSWKGGDCSDR